jgi:predicted PurR-regulated permease PerM
MYSIEKYRNVGFWIAVSLIIVISLYIVRPLWAAIAWGIALSIIVYPIHRRMSQKINETLSALITTLMTLIFIIVPILLASFMLYMEVMTLSAAVSNSQNESGSMKIDKSILEFEEKIKPTLANFGIEDFSLKETLQQVVQPLIGTAPTFVKSFIFSIITFAFAHILLFFILRDGHRLREPALELIPLTPEKSEEVLSSVYRTVQAVFFGVVMVALIQGVATGLLFWMVGVPTPLIWGLIAVILCAIPFLGAPILYVPLSTMLILNEEYTKGVLVLAIGLIVISSLDNLFRPAFIQTRVAFHYAAVFFSLIAGILTLGAVGVIIGPVMLCLLIGVVQILREMTQSAQHSASDSLPPSV